MALPNILSYLNYRVFLRAWLDARKAQCGAYSMATFAKAGGCSKAALANVLSGARNPRPATIDAFSQAMSLTPTERNYFGLLVELESAASLEARHEVMQRILESERFEQVRVADRQPERDIERYVEHWYVPVIRELATPRCCPHRGGAALPTVKELLAGTTEGPYRLAAATVSRPGASPR